MLSIDVIKVFPTFYMKCYIFTKYVIHLWIQKHNKINTYEPIYHCVYFLIPYSFTQSSTQK